MVPRGTIAGPQPHQPRSRPLAPSHTITGLQDCEYSSETLLTALRRDADTYKGFAQLDESTVAGHYYRLVIETMESAATTPVFLWLLSDNHAVPAA